MAKFKFEKKKVVEAIFEIPMILIKHMHQNEDFKDLSQDELLAKFSSMLVGTFLDTFDLTELGDEFVKKEKEKRDASLESSNEKKDA